MQSSMPELLGSSAFQLVYDSGVLDGLHTHAPSDAASADVIQLSSRVIQSDRTMLSRSLNPYNISMLIERRQHYNTQQLPMSGTEIWRHPDQPSINPHPPSHSAIPFPPKLPSIVGAAAAIAFRVVRWSLPLSLRIAAAASRRLIPTPTPMLSGTCGAALFTCLSRSTVPPSSRQCG